MIFGDEIPIESIEVRNQSHYNQDLLIRRINLDPESQPSSGEIEAGINRLYALDRFERITYKYEQREFENAIVVDVDEKDWGPNYLTSVFSSKMTSPQRVSTAWVLRLTLPIWGDKVQS